MEQNEEVKKFLIDLYRTMDQKYDEAFKDADFEYAFGINTCLDIIIDKAEEYGVCDIDELL